MAAAAAMIVVLVAGIFGSDARSLPHRVTECFGCCTAIEGTRSQTSTAGQGRPAQCVYNFFDPLNTCTGQKSLASAKPRLIAYSKTLGTAPGG